MGAGKRSWDAMCRGQVRRLLVTLRSERARGVATIARARVAIELDPRGDHMVQMLIRDGVFPRADRRVQGCRAFDLGALIEGCERYAG